MIIRPHRSYYITLIFIICPIAIAYNMG